MRLARGTQITIAISALLVLGVGSALAKTVNSRVTIKVVEANFQGKVISNAPRCVVARKVLIKRPVAGPDQIVTKTFATESGRYRAFIPQQGGQQLYAKINRYKPPGRQFFCAPDRSPIVTG